jgi:catechol 2,3-dioxygenase-like lactoylglutathione lyase family enzyme
MSPLAAMIYAKDVVAMTAFYRDVMGFPVVREDEGWVELEAGGFRLALHAIPAAISERIMIGTPPTPRADTPIKLLFASGHLGDLRARLRAVGGELPSRGRADASAPDRVDGFDCEGNVFTVHAR